jgi:hypothetical protein
MTGNADWKAYHSALSRCAELLDNMADGDPITDTPKFLAEKLASAAVAPWPDFLGQPIHHGARLLHPFDGSEFVAVRLNGHTDEGDAWRAVYDDGTVSRLCLQIGDKGQAVLSQKPASVPQSTVQVVAGFMLVVPDSPNPDCEEDDGAPWVIDAKRAKTFLSEPGFGPCKLEPIYRASHASPEVASAFMQAAKDFTQAHIDCDEFERAYEEDQNTGSDEDSIDLNAVYSVTKQRLVEAYRALAADA